MNPGSEPPKSRPKPKTNRHASWVTVILGGLIQSRVEPDWSWLVVGSETVGIWGWYGVISALVVTGKISCGTQMSIALEMMATQ